MYGMTFSGIHLASETHPKIVSSLIAGRADPDKKVETGQPENWKFDFGTPSNKKVKTLADRLSKLFR